MEITIETLGMTVEELRDRIVKRVAFELLSREIPTINEDGEPDVDVESTKLRTMLDSEIKERINSGIKAVADKFVAPNVGDFIESVTLQQTTSWGEKVGAPITFREYLVARAEQYMSEPVDRTGKSKHEQRYSSDWNQHGAIPRIVHMIDGYLGAHIEKAMKDALKVANSAIATGITEAVKAKLKEVTNGITATVQIPR